MTDKKNNHPGIETEMLNLRARIKELEKSEKTHLELKSCLEAAANDRIFSSAENLRRVLRLISRTMNHSPSTLSA